jgi:hypothetical protein
VAAFLAIAGTAARAESFLMTPGSDIVGALGLVRAASGALGSALGARVELEQLRRQPGRDPATGLPDARAFDLEAGPEPTRADEDWRAALGYWHKLKILCT